MVGGGYSNQSKFKHRKPFIVRFLVV